MAAKEETYKMDTSAKEKLALYGSFNGAQVGSYNSYLATTKSIRM